MDKLFETFKDCEKFDFKTFKLVWKKLQFGEIHFLPEVFCVTKITTYDKTQKETLYRQHLQQTYQLFIRVVLEPNPPYKSIGAVYGLFCLYRTQNLDPLLPIQASPETITCLLHRCCFHKQLMPEQVETTNVLKILLKQNAFLVCAKDDFGSSLWNDTLKSTFPVQSEPHASKREASQYSDDLLRSLNDLENCGDDSVHGQKARNLVQNLRSVFAPDNIMPKSDIKLPPTHKPQKSSTSILNSSRITGCLSDSKSIQSKKAWKYGQYREENKMTRLLLPNYQERNKTMKPKPGKSKKGLMSSLDDVENLCMTTNESQFSNAQLSSSTSSSEDEFIDCFVDSVESLAKNKLQGAAPTRTYKTSKIESQFKCNESENVKKLHLAREATNAPVNGKPPTAVPDTSVSTNRINQNSPPIDSGKIISPKAVDITEVSLLSSSDDDEVVCKAMNAGVLLKQMIDKANSGNFATTSNNKSGVVAQKSGDKSRKGKKPVRHLNKPSRTVAVSPIRKTKTTENAVHVIREDSSSSEDDVVNATRALGSSLNSLLGRPSHESKITEQIKKKKRFEDNFSQPLKTLRSKKKETTEETRDLTLPSDTLNNKSKNLLETTYGSSTSDDEIVNSTMSLGESLRTLATNRKRKKQESKSQIKSRSVSLSTRKRKRVRKGDSNMSVDNFIKVKNKKQILPKDKNSKKMAGSYRQQQKTVQPSSNNPITSGKVGTSTLSSSDNSESDDCIAQVVSMSTNLLQTIKK